ncbi:MAG: Crp/Fnr family transcriptional regulator [Eubacteriales bacterium]|nr:Crp/Fnr family transcriptional regulator [Eubacteriales bacterium]
MKKYLSVLRRCTLFQGLSDSEILSSLNCIGAETETREKNEYILRAGEKTDSVGLLLSGGALIIQEDLWGNRNVITRLGPGDFFAESFAAIPNTVLSVSVVATETSETMKMDITRMLTVCSSACNCHNQLIHNLVTALAGKLLVFNDKITHMSKRKTRDKLLSYLSAESLRQNSLSFDIPFDRQQLADFLCVERAAMSVELSKLQKEGLLKTDHSHFELNIEAVSQK